MFKNAIDNMFEIDMEYYRYVDDSKLTLGRILRLELRLAKETMNQFDRMTFLAPTASFDFKMRMARRAAWFALYPKIYVRELVDAIHTEFYKK